MPSPLVASRVRLSAEPDRDTALVWTFDGDLTPLVWAFAGKPATPEPISYTEAWYDPGFHGLFRLPPGIAPGTYPLDCGNGHTLALTVTAPLKRTVTTATSVATLKARLAPGQPVDVTLAPGTYVFDAPLALPAGTILRGDHATLVRKYTTDYAGTWAFFVPSDDCAFYDLTFRHEPGDHSVFAYRGGAPVGLVIVRCEFVGGGVGNFFDGVYCRDSVFKGGAGYVNNGLYVRCTVTGPLGVPAQAAAISYQDRLAIVDCLFDGTDRGPVIGGSAVADHLRIGNAYRNILRTGNGNEINLFEQGNPFRRFVALHERVTNCLSTYCQIGGGSVSDILIRDYYQDGGAGFSFWWAPTTNVVVQDFELRGGAGIYCGPNASGCRFVDGSVFGWCPGRGNQQGPSPSPLNLGRTVAAWNEGDAANTLERVRCETLPGYVPSRGFTVK